MNSKNKSKQIDLWNQIKDALSKKEVKISILKRAVSKEATLFKENTLSTSFFVGSSDEARNDSRFYFSQAQVGFNFLGEITKDGEDYFFELQEISPENKIFFGYSWDKHGLLIRPINKGVKKRLVNNNIIYFGKPKLDTTVELRFNSSTAFSKYLKTSIIVFSFLIALIILILLSLSTITYFEVPIPSYSEPIGSVTILDRNGANVLTTQDSFLLKNKKLITNQYYISTKGSGRYLADAIIASEDRSFRDNPVGFDIPLVLTVIAKSIVTGIPITEGSGASTIYQQVASKSGIIPKSYIDKEDRSVKRKFREAVAAFKLINTFGSEKVLEIYINTIHFGNGNDGVQAASYFYFGKSVPNLTLSEAAIIVGAIQTPCFYNLIAEGCEVGKQSKEQVIEKMIKRRSIILSTMVETKFIKKEEAEKANKEPINLVAKFTEDFVLPSYIQEKINNLIDKDSGTEKNLIFQIGTNRDIQKKSDKALVNAVSQYGNSYNFSQGAIVTLDTRDGSILALTGGLKSDYDRATEAQRAPGSTFKIFTFLAALESGISPSKGFECSQTDGIAGCQRSGAARSISMIDGFIRSENVVAVRIARQVGFENVIKVAKKLGITTDLGESSNMVLGGQPAIVIEMASAYAAIVNDGVYNKPLSIINFKKCKEVDKNVCNTVFEYSKEKIQPNPVIAPKNARVMVSMMRGVVENGGTGVYADIVDEYVVGKTGTTDQSRDLWFIGALPEKHLLAAIWLGNDEGTTNGNSSIAAQVWNEYFREILRKAN
jgi:membrane peptidoglycan carboxypeptidase